MKLTVGILELFGAGAGEGAVEAGVVREEGERAERRVGERAPSRRLVLPQQPVAGLLRQHVVVSLVRHGRLVVAADVAQVRTLPTCQHMCYTSCFYDFSFNF